MMEIRIVGGQVRKWLSLLWRGVSVEVMVGGSVEELLVGQLGIDNEFVEERIRTVFLDGHPVDDLGGAIVGEGSQVALSGALPGMIGLAMRRQSPVAHMREGITCQTSGEKMKRQKGWITLKLFNDIAESRGPMILARGFRIEAELLKSFLDDAAVVGQVGIDGEVVGWEELKSRLSQVDGSGWVWLQVGGE